MPDAGEHVQRRVTGQLVPKPARLADRDPRVGRAPTDRDRAVNLVQGAHEWLSVLRGQCRDLPIEGFLPLPCAPGRDQHLEVALAQWTVGGAADVLADQGSMEGGRQSGEDVGMLGDETEEGGPPRVEEHGIPQHERGELAAMVQVGAEGDGGADVVGDHMGALEAPTLEQDGEAAHLSLEVDGDIRPLAGEPVAGHVP